MAPEGGRVPLPDDLPVIERSAVRLVVLDTQGRLLLFRTHDNDYPELGTWWELPGGGIEPGETYLDAAIRELREETGIIAAPSQVGPPTWKRRASFKHRQSRHVQDEVIVTLRLPGPGRASTSHCAWITKRRTTSASAGGRRRRSAAVASVSTPASCPSCSMPSSTARKSMNRSSFGHDSELIHRTRAGPPRSPAAARTVRRTAAAGP
jgi:8-oxo-dGTP pyrophosphatase MutT (NUDIX family)